jgi:hypothetical protein
MAWVKIDDNAPHHKKMLKAGPAACWLWVCGLAYCQKHHTDGFIPAEALPWLGVQGPHKLAGLLGIAGLWHAAENGWLVHDYLTWNDSAEDRRAKSEDKTDRQQKWRDKKAKERASDASTRRDVDASTPRHRDTAPPPTPQPTPQPQPTPPPTNGARVAAGAPGLVTSSADYDRLRKTHRHVGTRVRVPNVLHAELMTKLGGENPDAALSAWYAELDAEAEASREPIPDLFTWLRPKFVAWAGAGAKADDWAKWAPGGAFDQQIGGKS